MKYIKGFINYYKEKYNKDELIILLVCCSIFLPFYITGIVLLLAINHLIKTKQLITLLKEYPEMKYLNAFTIILLIASALGGNDLGIFATIGIYCVIIFINYYRKFITSKLFNDIIHYACILSVCNAFLAIVEYYQIAHSLGYRFLLLQVEDDPMYRVNASFFNANYYAMMIEFIVICCVYKLLKFKGWIHSFTYLFIIAINLFALYLCGCRTAWPAIVVAIVVMLLVSKNYKAFMVASIILATGGIILLLNPSLFPRVESLSLYFEYRQKIWETAFKGIQQHPLIGRGPLTYMKLCREIGGTVTEHAHSIYIEPFLSYGVLGVSALLAYMFNNIKAIYRLYKSKIDYNLIGLMVGTLFIVLVHGIMDYTIFWIQTAMFFFVLFSSFMIYKNNQKEVA